MKITVVYKSGMLVEHDTSAQTTSMPFPTTNNLMTTYRFRTDSLDKAGAFIETFYQDATQPVSVEHMPANYASVRRGLAIQIFPAEDVCNVERVEVDGRLVLLDVDGTLVNLIRFDQNVENYIDNANAKSIVGKITSFIWDIENTRWANMSDEEKVEACERIGLSMEVVAPIIEEEEARELKKDSASEEVEPENDDEDSEETEEEAEVIEQPQVTRVVPAGVAFNAWSDENIIDQVAQNDGVVSNSVQEFEPVIEHVYLSEAEAQPEEEEVKTIAAEQHAEQQYDEKAAKKDSISNAVLHRIHEEYGEPNSAVIKSKSNVSYSSDPLRDAIYDNQAEEDMYNKAGQEYLEGLGE